MAFTVGNSGFAGDWIDDLYLILSTGNEAVDKGSVFISTDIDKDRAIPNMRNTENPIGAYTTAVSSDTVTTTYAERSLSPNPMTVNNTILPELMQDIWPSWHPFGDFTNLEVNRIVLLKLLELHRDGIADQINNNFWNGDTGGALPTNLFDGIITRAEADANVINPAAAGAITDANVIDILFSVYQSIPPKFLGNPDFKLHMSTTTYRLLQEANVDAKKTTTGVLSMGDESFFMNHPIEFYNRFPDDRILGARVSSSNVNTANLLMGVYVDFMLEQPLLERKANGERNWVFRFDMKVDANYKEATELVLYEDV